ncbi:MAG: glycosyl hydrolase [Steroidobacteraceae bacterium]
MLTYPYSGGAPTGVDWRYATPNYGAWSDGTNLYYREYSDLFTTSNLSQFPTITTLYSGAGLSVPSGYMGGTWHNWPNTTTTSIVTGLGTEQLDDMGMTFKTVRSHDYFPNSTGSVRWHHLETSKGTFVWTNLDKFVNDHYAAGYDIIYTLGYSPAWATGTGSGDSHYDNGAVPISSSNPPTSLTDWTDYCSAVATRYTGKIKYYEIWNEPDQGSSFWNGTQTQYAQLLRLANQTIKAIDASALIMGPASSRVDSTGRSWLTSMFAASDGASGTGATGSSGQKWIDVISIHNYYSGTLNATSFLSDLTSYKSILSSNGYGSKEIWVNECGINSVHMASNEDVQMKYFLRQLYMMATQGISRIVWYDMDGSLLSPFRKTGNLSHWANIWNTHRGYLVNGQVTLVNRLADGTLAVTANGSNFLI